MNFKSAFDFNENITDESDNAILFYADLMGFKSRIKEQDHDNLKTELESLFQHIKDGLEEYIYTNNINENKGSRLVIFSDTIIFYDTTCDEYAFKRISRAAIRIFNICLERGFALKGVITKGKIYCSDDRTLMFGRAFVDAYEFHDHIKYYGIVVHHSAEKLVKEYKRDMPYILSKIPIDDEKIEHWHLCWNLQDKYFYPKDNTKYAIQLLAKVAEHVSGHPRKYIDLTKIVLKNDSEVFAEYMRKLNETRSLDSGLKNEVGSQIGYHDSCLFLG